MCSNAHAGDVLTAECEKSLNATCCCAKCSALELCANLRKEFKPVGAAENILVAELARRAANMEWWSDAASAVRRTAANSLEYLVVPASGSPEQPHTILAAAASCDAVERAERTSSTQSRAFHRALQTLLHLQQRRMAAGDAVVVSPASNRFTTEATCWNYLVDWQCAKFVCRACGAHHARLVESRCCLECIDSGAQSGLRVATVMANSSLQLVIWFAAIQIVVENPDIGTTDLQEQLKLSRPATARNGYQNPRSADGRRPHGPLGRAQSLFHVP